MLFSQLFAVAPLFAVGDLIGLIIWIVIIVVSVISKISKATGGAQQKPPANRPPPQPGRPKARAGGGKKGIESEIEDFLRQARGEKARQNPTAATPPRQARQSPARTKPQPPRKRPHIVEATPVERDIVPGEGFGKSVSTHVQEHIGKDSISTRDAHLAESIELADERIEQHLEDVFDHDVGHIDHAVKVDTSIAEGTDALENQAENDKSAVAKRIREMLSSPESIREVFIASEILKRPEI